MHHVSYGLIAAYPATGLHTHIGNTHCGRLTWAKYNLVFTGVANPGRDDDLFRFSPCRTSGA